LSHARTQYCSTDGQSARDGIDQFFKAAAPQPEMKISEADAQRLAEERGGISSRDDPHGESWSVEK